MITCLNWGIVDVEIEQKKKTYINCTVALGTNEHIYIEVYGVKNWQELSYMYVDGCVKYIDSEKMIIHAKTNVNGEIVKTPVRIYCTRPIINYSFRDEILKD